MKHVFSLLLSALFCLGMAACSAEGDGLNATLTFSSFDGGGHEYSVEIGDPSTLACTVERDYGDDRHELEDGSPYRVIMTFEGLRPGSTAVTVYGRSPNMENDDAVYTATVDTSLRVTLTAVRAISTFFAYRSSDIHYDTYSITRERDGYRVSVNDGEAQAIDAASMDALARVVDEYGLEGWDGFSESKHFVLDGESFWLEIRLTDGTHILARGDNVFPENYFPAMGEIWDILTGAEIAD